MTSGWAVQLAIDDAPSLALLRAFSGIEMAEVQGTIWARGNSTNDELERALCMLPLRGRYVVGADGQLVPRGRRVPQGHLPRAEWQPLDRRIVVDLPLAALPGELGASALADGMNWVQRATLRIVRSAEEQPATALVTELARWAAYGTTAPEVRLKPLAFALAHDGRVLVRGTPLPPLAGERYTADGGVAVPCGFSLEPRLDAAVVRRWLQAAEDDMLLFAPDGSYERIAADDFVAASRSAVRKTAEEAAHV